MCALKTATRDEPAAGIDLLTALVKEDMAHVNGEIIKRSRSHVDMIPEIAGHLIKSGGKRLRPMLTLAAAAICGYDGAYHVKLAAAVEFMHTATLLHDDVVDESDLRRGKATARIVWGNEASVLVGDYLLGQAFKMMVETGSLPALSVLSNAACVIAEGEVLQLGTAKNIATSEQDYLKVVNAKTAALFAAAAEVGAIVADAGIGKRRALNGFGENLGMAFQLIDDALDYAGEQATLGKTVGDDFHEGKITLPVVLCLKQADDGERAFWRRSLQKLDQSEADLGRALELMAKYGALEETVAQARQYGAAAKQALSTFPDGRYKSALLEAVDFCVERAH
jgi:octaprenyl-diphosphate synthase